MKAPRQNLIVMCKAPLAGTVKTRLMPFLSADQAAELAVCFARDSIEKARKFNLQPVVAYAPENGKKALEKFLLPHNFLWTAQRGANLGEKMHNALVFGFGQNSSPLVVTGTDSPNLPPEFIAQAFQILAENQDNVVLGETLDGGYYLIGLNKADKRIFQNVEWSSPRTLADTARNIKSLNLKLNLLPAWYDVDTPEDLFRLRWDILTDEQAANAVAPQTTAWLKQNESLFQVEERKISA